MTVYVDDMRRRAQIGNGRPGNWSHLFADTPAELKDIARQLSLRPEWIQHEGTYREHFDVTETVRGLAVHLGATEIAYPRGTADLLARKRAARISTNTPSFEASSPTETGEVSDKAAT